MTTLYTTWHGELDYKTVAEAAHGLVSADDYVVALDNGKTPRPLNEQETQEEAQAKNAGSLLQEKDDYNG